MMRGVSRRGVFGAGLLALTGAGLWTSAGCGVIVDGPRLDPRSEQRPGTWVRRLEENVAELRAAYDHSRLLARDERRCA